MREPDQRVAHRLILAETLDPLSGLLARQAQLLLATLEELRDLALAARDAFGRSPVSTWTLVDDAFRARLLEVTPDVLFATEREQEAVGELDTRWVVKRGAQGLTVDGRDYPALPSDVVDTTGAGDALAAGFHVGGPQLGVEIAARCCAQMGAMP